MRNWLPSRLMGALQHCMQVIALHVMLAGFLFAGSAVIVHAPLAGAETLKQDNDKPSIFRRIFRKDKTPEETPEPEQPAGPQTVRRPTTTPAKVITVKDTGASKVLVAGDFLGGSLARGLTDAYAADKSFVIVNRTQPASGVVRDEVFDWAAALREELAGGDYAAVVFLVGTNDRQGFIATKPRIALTNSEWTVEYSRRVVDLSQILSSTHTVPIWVGVPPVRPKKLNAHGIAVSSIFRSQAVKKNIAYVDLFDAFTDEAGNFVYRGPDIGGKSRTLRTRDGVNFTRAGRRKLAWYVEQHLERELRSDTRTLAAAGDLNSAVGLSEGMQIGPVLSLNVSADFATDTLAGAVPITEYTDAESQQYRRLITGLSLPLVPGRVDDFRLTQPGMSELTMRPAAEKSGGFFRTDAAARPDDN